MIEGFTLRRIGNCFRQFFLWLDKKLGTMNRYIVMPHWKVRSNSIMFFPYQHDVACNPKYISEELIRRMPDIDIYWSVFQAQTKSIDTREVYAKLTNGTVDTRNSEFKKMDRWVKEHVHFVRSNSYEYFVAAGTSKVLVCNSILGDKFYQFPVKRDQYVVETWHGSLGIKRFDPDHYNTNMSWPVAAKWTGKVTTHCFSNSTFEDKVFRTTFWPDTQILRYGHARNDVFFDNFSGTRAYHRNKFIKDYRLDPETHFALYAPTFRDDHNFMVYDLDTDRVVDALSKRFGGKWILMLRYHDNDKKLELKRNQLAGSNVIDVTQLPDMQSLLTFTDVAITDYSSWIYDFVLTGKPGFIFAMDIEEYNNERGFYFKLEDTPFPVATDSDEIVDNILKFDEQKYAREVDRFLSDKGCMDDGHAAEREADQILEWMGR